jgi:hypothetical protein
MKSEFLSLIAILILTSFVYIIIDSFAFQNTPDLYKQRLYEFNPIYLITSSMITIVTMTLCLVLRNKSNKNRECKFQQNVSKRQISEPPIYQKRWEDDTVNNFDNFLDDLKSSEEDESLESQAETAETAEYKKNSRKRNIVNHRPVTRSMTRAERMGQDV